jgi:hypothetical protein
VRRDQSATLGRDNRPTLNGGPGARQIRRGERAGEARNATQVVIQKMATAILPDVGDWNEVLGHMSPQPRFSDRSVLRS